MGKELRRTLDWSGKLSSRINYDTPEEETIEFFKSLSSPENEPSLDNFKVDGSIYIPVTDDPIKDVLFGLVHLLFNVIFFAIDTVRWAPSMLFTIRKKGNLKESLKIGEAFSYQNILMHGMIEFSVIE